MIFEGCQGVHGGFVGLTVGGSDRLGWVNLDPVVDISDALVVIDDLFAGSMVSCLSALDADDNEAVRTQPREA